MSRDDSRPSILGALTSPSEFVQVIRGSFIRLACVRRLSFFHSLSVIKSDANLIVMISCSRKVQESQTAGKATIQSGYIEMGKNKIFSVTGRKDQTFFEISAR